MGPTHFNVFRQKYLVSELKLTSVDSKPNNFTLNFIKIIGGNELVKQWCIHNRTLTSA